MMKILFPITALMFLAACAATSAPEVAPTCEYPVAVQQERLVNALPAPQRAIVQFRELTRSEVGDMLRLYTQLPGPSAPTITQTAGALLVSVPGLPGIVVIFHDGEGCATGQMFTTRAAFERYTGTHGEPA